MKSMKFYIYSSNLAILIFGMIFIAIGYMRMNMILMMLGILLAIYGSFRLYRMLKALQDQDDDQTEEDCK